MNQFKSLHGKYTTNLPRDWNSQPTEYHFKYRTSPTNTTTVVSDIMGIFNHHAIDNGYVEVHHSEFSVESNYKSVPDSCTNPIKSIFDNEIDHLL